MLVAWFRRWGAAMARQRRVEARREALRVEGGREVAMAGAAGWHCSPTTGGRVIAPPPQAWETPGQAGRVCPAASGREC